MKCVIVPLVICLLVCACTSPEEAAPPETEKKRPSASSAYFNQANINLDLDQANCLLEGWYSDRFYSEIPVAFRVIEDESSYRSFFNCKEGIALKPIDFTKEVLLVGTNAGSGAGNDAPVRITGMRQELFPKGDHYVLRVTVKGRKNNPGGGEWFGFVSLVPRTYRNTKLELNFIYQ
ncbi:hypothetical protein GCM10023091_23220 [Ravibacter arvi]|uniref:Lipoprotein n=1 Tax=Ravibacter arvi TaxID=2051041 RepID=A0ABP8LZV6_9BACT